MNKFTTLFYEYFLPRLGVDIFPFFLALMLLALLSTGLRLNFDFIAGAIANYLLLVWAFIYNDIEDRADDAQSTYLPQTLSDNIVMMTGRQVQNRPAGTKRFRNPFAFGVLSVTEGYVILAVIALISCLISWGVGGVPTLVVALSNLLVGWLYSYRRVRLKSTAYFDLVSHAYLLAAVQIIYFVFYPNALNPIWGVLMALLVFINSVSGDLRNELRDFTEDQAHGVRNTATLLGPQRTAQLSLRAHQISLVLIVIVCALLVAKRIGLF